MDWLARIGVNQWVSLNTLMNIAQHREDGNEDGNENESESEYYGNGFRYESFIKDLDFHVFQREPMENPLETEDKSIRSGIFAVVCDSFANFGSYVWDKIGVAMVFLFSLSTLSFILIFSAIFFLLGYLMIKRDVETVKVLGFVSTFIFIPRITKN